NRSQSAKPSGPKTTSVATGIQTVAAASAAAATIRRALRDGRLRDGRLDRRAPAVALDELLGELMCLVILDLNGRRLHQVRARLDERAGDAVVQCELREPDGVDDDAGRVR